MGAFRKRNSEEASIGFRRAEDAKGMPLRRRGGLPSDSRRVTAEARGAGGERLEEFGFYAADFFKNLDRPVDETRQCFARRAARTPDATGMGVVAQILMSSPTRSPPALAA